MLQRFPRTGYRAQRGLSSIRAIEVGDLVDQDYSPPRSRSPRSPRRGRRRAIRSRGGSRAWGRDEGGEVGAWSSGGGGGLGRQDTMRQETVRGRAGMPSTSAI